MGLPCRFVTDFLLTRKLNTVNFKDLTKFVRTQIAAVELLLPSKKKPNSRTAMAK